MNEQEHLAMVMDEFSKHFKERDPAEHYYDSENSLAVMSGNYRAATPAFRRPLTIRIWFDMGWDGDRAYGTVRAVDIVDDKGRYARRVYEDLSMDAQIACDDEVQAYLDDGYTGN